jgi:diacylglycerol kinase family enzyme
MRQRIYAALALALTLAAFGIAIGLAVDHFPNGLTVLACGLAAVCSAWYGLRRRGSPRVVGVAGAVLCIGAAVVLMIIEGRILGDLLLLASIAGGLAAARQAFSVHADMPRAAQPQHAVLFYNPKSGGGKAERFKLPEQARLRGIEPIELKPGEDLEALVRDAVSGGADALAMAGGDGSQAIVAMVAAEFDLPYACIPSGTRNHFALDLGVDRNDVVGALDALVDGGERRVDLAEVNGQVFVNNVSLGLYADAVQNPGYRAAKLHTLLETIPDVLGPDAAVPNLHWDAQTGEESAAAILISNNPYRLGHALGSGTRPRLDRGELGITVLIPTLVGGDAGAASRKLSIRQWTASTFAVEASGSVAAGIDGEAMRLQPPLSFTVRPRALRVRIAPHHPGASPSVLEPDRPWQALASLAGFVVHGMPALDFEAANSPQSGDDRALVPPNP